MEHEDAVSTNAAERYLLGEMNDPERDGYEEHFFGCPECAETVKLAARFRDAARQVLREGSGPGQLPAQEDEGGGSKLLWTDWRSLFWPMPQGVAAALVVLVGLAGYQSLLVLPGLRSELREARSLQSAPSYFLSVSRSETPVVRAVGLQRMVALRLSQSFDRAFDHYLCEVRDAEGRTLLSSVLAAPPPGEELQVLLPVEALPPGAYVIALAGLESASGRDPASEFSRYHFTFERGESGEERP